MKIKMGDKEYFVQSENVPDIVSKQKGKEESFPADCIQVYAHYGKHYYSKRKNLIEIPLSAKEFDLGRAVIDFPFEHDNFTNKQIIDYTLYYANSKWSKKLNVYRKILEIPNTIKPAEEKFVKQDSNKTKSDYIPTEEDYEMAYKKIAKPGEEIDVNKLLDKLHEELTKQGKVLDQNWRKITIKNIEKWSSVVLS